MRLSKNFVNEYTNLNNIEFKELADGMLKLGNEYESISKLVNATKVITGEVIECVNHPDSDHLHVLKVDVGNEVLQIVCGAANVAQDKLVVVALNNTMMMDGSVIRPGSLRGVASNGMCCSKRELGLTKDPARVGIILLDETYKVGEDFDFKG